MIQLRHLLLAFPSVLFAATVPEAFEESQGLTLFAFDEMAIPFAQNLRLEMRAPARHPANPVLSRGAPGSPDALGVNFYGSVVRENGKFRMWYVAFDDEVDNQAASARWRPAYAESQDGLHWTKPHLGLAEYRGNKDNNLVHLHPAPLGMVNLKVLPDPEDPDPERRYKMSAHVYFRGARRLGTLAPFASADGLRWKLLTPAQPVKAELRREDLVLPPIHFEPCGGLYRWDGWYWACGQNALNARQPYQGRVARVYRSADFRHWTATSGIAFVRAVQHGSLGPGRSLEGEQTHEGISVWNRGNVLLGLYGRWHGAKDWQDVTLDLGFVYSHDGQHFQEPAHEWTFLERGKDGDWDQGGVLQGQGFENVEDQTFIYYGAWDPRRREKNSARGGVGIAVLPRDRFGDLVVETAGQGPGDYQLPRVQSEFVTVPVPLAPGLAHRFFVNADGLGAEAALKIELLDERENALPGYSGDQAARVGQSGFHTPVSWGDKTGLSGLPARIRLKVAFEGAQREAIRFSALYLQPVRRR